MEFERLANAIAEVLDIDASKITRIASSLKIWEQTPLTYLKS